MTRTKRYLKAKGYRFSEDYRITPYDDEELELEWSDALIAPEMVFIVNVFTTLIRVYRVNRQGGIRMIIQKERKPR